MFFSIFGGVWLCFWVYLAFAGRPLFIAIVAVLAMILAGFSYRRYRRHRLARAAEAALPSRRRASRIFNIANTVQWIAIFVAVQVLAHFGLSGWIVPAIIFIVGLHFLPLAYALAWRPHYMTGGALMLLAVVYPLLAPAGPASPVGCLGAGLILWISALWALMADSVSVRA